MELIIAVQKKKKKKNHYKSILPNMGQFTIQDYYTKYLQLHNRLLAAFSDKCSFNLSWHALNE